MKALKSFPFYTFLLALFLCLHVPQEYARYLPVADFVKVLGVVLISIIVLVAVVWAWSRSILYAGFVAFILAAVYLFFGDLLAGLRPLGFFGRYIFVLPFLFVSVLVVAIITRSKHQFLTKATLFLNALLIIYCLVDAGIILRKQFSQKEISFVNKVRVDEKKVESKPNVYFLLFDEYAGYMSLSQKFGFKNDSLYATLSKDGFTVLPSFSNYSSTAYSMASILNMDYIPGLAYGDKINFKHSLPRLQEIKRGKLFEIFKQLGYKINSYSLFDVGNRKSLGAKQFFADFKDPLTFNFFHNIVIKDIGWHLATGKYSMRWMQQYMLKDLPVFNEKVEEGLLGDLAQKVTPQFTYAHFLMPHPPFLFDSNGVRRKFASLFEEGASYSNERYVAYLKYCNQKMVDYERSIIESDPGAIIILMSDHGARLGLANIFPSAFDNFCAIRTPGKELTQPAGKISGVNVYRYLLNNVFNQKIPYLKDSMILLHEVNTDLR